MKEKNNLEGRWTLKNHRSAIFLKTFCCLSYLQIQIYFCHLIPQGQSRPRSWPSHLVRRVHPLCRVILWLFLLRLSLGYFPPGPLPHSWWEYINSEWQSCLSCTRELWSQTDYEVAPFSATPDCLGHEKSHFPEKWGVQCAERQPWGWGICKRTGQGRTPGKAEVPLTSWSLENTLRFVYFPQEFAPLSYKCF